VIAINKYELMLIVNPNADEERQKEIVERLRTTVEKGEGVYTVITFTATPTTLAEVERVLGITDEVLRFKTIRLKS
jgi:ribosomal protein S6